MGINKINNDLKTSLKNATVKENWNLIHNITDFIKNNIAQKSIFLDNRIDRILDKEHIEFTDNKKENQLSRIVNYEIWDKIKFLLIKILEIEADKIVFKAIIFRLYSSYQKPFSNTTNYSNINYKYKDHWLLGLAQGLSALASTGVGDSTMKRDEGYSDFGCDSCDFMELIMAVEEEFDIEIPDEKSDNIETVQDLYYTVISYLKEQE